MQTNTTTPFHRIGYARVSSADQNPDSQIDGLQKAGCGKIFSDKMTGSHMDRPGWEQLLEYARPGDTLVISLRPSKEEPSALAAHAGICGGYRATGIPAATRPIFLVNDGFNPYSNPLIPAVCLTFQISCRADKRSIIRQIG